MNRWFKTGILIGGALLLTVLLKLYVLTQLSISDNSLSPAFRQGDRVLVSRLSYVLGQPVPQKGDWIAFSDPLSRENASAICLGQCTFLPGDTLWLQMQQDSVLQKYPFVVPRQGQYISVKPWNIHLLANTLRLHEGCNVCEDGDSLLIVDGQPLQSVRFSQGYLWIGSPDQPQAYDSRIFGFVPLRSIQGKVVRHFCLPWSRTFSWKKITI